MRQAICPYAERVGKKLCGGQQFCHHVSVFIRSFPFDTGYPGYGNTAFVRLHVGTQDTRHISRLPLNHSTQSDVRDTDMPKRASCLAN
ncbi:hypothetical protein ACCY16_20170 [Candidatus Pantoea formicae]|uniref:hypothetical protein n=1 Tax=Candidatus Pantoea formicae TaxID=2608355 RepID=UPI003EDB5CBB